MHLYMMKIGDVVIAEEGGLALFFANFVDSKQRTLI